jgi:hypothetical protein
MGEVLCAALLSVSDWRVPGRWGWHRHGLLGPELGQRGAHDELQQVVEHHRENDHADVLSGEEHVGDGRPLPKLFHKSGTFTGLTAKAGDSVSHGTVLYEIKD